ncbi:MAG TPA: carboxypeptidase regulatory-like domain-containing protein [Anaerohalosphaeraceae bacterium]|nr:carboxypeptidase regulatory-like domain-containing protein [Anaerohalosphaeraceae bacterium]HOL89891.1 carboxypeptidase regulatory-like domain-containing protein [Anaerohalosphaeraceae bacterium]HPP57266.1 carboxypeptidase regulatory-like domain-containing protein [Anaerohalosphaeraceae bacterium]
MKDSCRDIGELLAERLLGPLAPAQQERLERHLERCAACRQVARQLEKHDRYLSDWSQTMRAYLSDKAERAAEAFLAAGPIRQTRPLRWGWVVSAAAVVMAGAAVWLMQPSRKDIEFRQELFKGIVSEPAPADRISAVPVVRNQGQLEEQTKIQLRQARYFFETKNIPALAALYQSGTEPTRLAVLDYLAQINTPEALRVLEDLQKQSAPPPAEPNQHSAIVPRAGSVPGAAKKQTEPPVAAVEPARPVWFDPNAVDADNWRTGVLGIQVVDAVTGEPIPGAELKFDAAEGIAVRQAKTNQFGRYELAISSSKPRFFRIEVRKKSYVPKLLMWAPEIHPAEVPLQIAVRMSPAASVGGLVRTVEGEPLEGVRIRLDSFKTAPGETNLFEPREVLTDHDGRWVFHGFPADAKENVSCSAVHPDYVPIERFGLSAAPESLFSREFLIVMKRAHTVSVRVLNSDRNPMEGAVVWMGSHPALLESKYKTDREGICRISPCPPGTVYLVATAEGFAPSMQKVYIDDSLGEVLFELTSGLSADFRVVDSRGYSLPGVKIEAYEWRFAKNASEYRLLIPFSSSVTDVQGAAVLKNLPAGKVVCRIAKSGFASYENFCIEPEQPSRYEIVLLPAGNLTGRVLDAQTGLPVEQFTLIDGYDWENQGKPVWQPHLRKEFSGGRYEKVLYRQDVGLAVRIEADGYLPAASRVYWNEGREVVEDIYLQKDTRALIGTVLDTNGLPVSSVSVYIDNRDSSILIQDGRILMQPPITRSVCTDSEGRFVLSAVQKPYRLLVCEKDGWAMAEDSLFEKEPVLRLQPWSRVEGRFFVQNKPSPNQILILSCLVESDALQRAWSNSYRVTTDAQGRFFCSRLFPGQITISRLLPSDEIDTIHSVQLTKIQVKPGQTVFIELGKEGRRVTGRLRLTEDMQGRSGEHISLSIQASVPQAEPKPFPDFEMPVDYFLMTPEEQEQWIADLMKTPQMKAYYQKTDQTEKPFLLEAEVRADGTFIADGVPPGSYILSGMVHRPGTVRDSVEWYFRSLGKIHTVFEVPPTAGEEDSGKSVDIGEIAVKPLRELTVGEPLELPAMEDLQGHPIFLSDYTGRYLLVDFVMISGPFQHEKTLEELKQLYRLHQPSGRLDVLSVCLEPFAAYERRNASVLKALRHFSEKKEIPWKIGLLLSPLDFDTALYRTLFAARGSSLFLVDPQGRIAALDIPLDRLEETLAHYLPAELGNP